MILYSKRNSIDRSLFVSAIKGSSYDAVRILNRILSTEVSELSTRAS